MFLHADIIANGPKIIPQVQETRWPDATHHDRFLSFHKATKIRIVQSLASNLNDNAGLLPTANRQLPTKNYICPMEVNDALVDKLAHLAMLKFEASEKEEIKNDLQKMIAFIEKLNELDTRGVEPLLHLTDEVNVLREDEVQGSISREDALKSAPLHDDEFFKVPKVIKK